MAKRQSRATWLLEQLQAQHKWIADHGGSKAAYVERYGSASGLEFYGAGGEAIYEADVAALREWERKYAAAVKRSSR